MSILQSTFLNPFWILELALSVALLIGFNLLLKRILLHMQKRAEEKGSHMHVHLSMAMAAPLRLLVWVFFLAFVADLFSRGFQWDHTASYIRPVRNVGLILCLAWLLLRWKRAFHTALMTRSLGGKLAPDPTSMQVLGRLFTIFVIFASLLIIMQIFGLDIAPLITFGGIGAAALGIASKDVIANFFGGLMIYATRPFMLGDFVEIPDKSTMGAIEEIGWYHTVVRDLQKRPLYIPNATFTTGLVVNWSRITHRRIDETLLLRLEDMPKMAKIVEEIRAFLTRHKGVDSRQPIYVFFKSFGTYSLDLLVQAYTLTTRYDEFMQLKQNVLLEIHEIIRKEGAEVSLPLTGIQMSQ